ncbi:hypothetical protein MCANPG14_00903 [Mycoplasmopsis canis PG 14]|uniref:Uncharacterized protein n=1 Tax=Mycoplasmopsis canis TaxID=29555 RepID=A0A449AQ79_9BACT|nr:hypothetical protein [Mycoplasmopsis canis]AMD81333.1 hypothetical protein AXW82_02095 [Mycoplasmopsis canis PG 14]EIE40523.1 hypothetical protein MCANPG14_00903 [Mycoplasmopsis canis PG 14]VEU68693.1 Uncharacterised protein [Mycoplasmopsis canis]
MKNKIIKFGFLILLTSFISASIIGGLVISKKNIDKKVVGTENNNNKLEEKKNNYIEKDEISQFKLETGKLDKKEVFASKYANNPTFIKSSFNTPRGDSSFWKNQLIFSRILQQNELNKDKLFGLNHPKNIILNKFTDKFKISFNSYANDLEGILYLKVTFTPKDSTKLSDQFEHIFSLNGFKKYNENDFSEGMFIKNININKENIKQFNNFNAFIDEYNKANSQGEEKKSEFINKMFSSFDSSPTASLDSKSINLEFDKANNKIIFKSILKALINASTEKDLNKIISKETSIEAKFEITYPSNNS